MSGNLPFGFNPGDPDDSGDGGGGADSGSNPFGTGGFDPSKMDMTAARCRAAAARPDAAVRRRRRRLRGQLGLARDTARGLVAQQGDPSVSAIERRDVEQALDLATLWLDPVTSFPATASGGGAWSRSEWIEATLPQWRTIVEPVAEKVNESMSGMMPTGGMPEGLPPEARADGRTADGDGPPDGLDDVRRAARAGSRRPRRRGAQRGRRRPPPGPRRPAAPLPRNIAAFADGLERRAEQVRLYLALREAAHQRLFAHVPWLREQLSRRGRGLRRAASTSTRRHRGGPARHRPENPESIQQALASGVFEPDETPEQQAALSRLETLLALVEGWVDDVVARGRGRPAARRRCAARDDAPSPRRWRTGRAARSPRSSASSCGPGACARPRPCGTPCAAARGREGRDALWEHPDLLPTGRGPRLPRGDRGVRAALGPARPVRPRRPSRRPRRRRRPTDPQE